MRLKSVNIQGYRPFRNFEAPLQRLEILERLPWKLNVLKLSNHLWNS